MADELRRAMNELMSPTRPRVSVPLCGTCGQSHDPRTSKCPPRFCIMCGTIHLPNKSFNYDLCERNERFAQKSRESEEWAARVSKEIHAQPDVDSENEDKEG